MLFTLNDIKQHANDIQLIANTQHSMLTKENLPDGPDVLCKMCNQKEAEYQEAKAKTEQKTSSCRGHVRCVKCVKCVNGDFTVSSSNIITP
jgi:hypothetical protein